MKCAIIGICECERQEAHAKRSASRYRNIRLISEERGMDGGIAIAGRF